MLQIFVLETDILGGYFRLIQRIKIHPLAANLENGIAATLELGHVKGEETKY